MRILVVNHRDWLNPRAGGVEEVLFQTTRRWAAAGHEIELLTSNFPGASQSRLVDSGVAITRLGREETFNWLALSQIRHRAERVDVIVEHLSKVASMCPWQTPRPVIGYLHHLFGRTIFGNIALPVAAYVVGMEELALRVYRHCRFIAVSESTASDLTRQGIPRTQVEVVYNGLDHDLFQPAVPSRKTVQPSVLWVGRIRKTKCVTHVIEAFALLAARLPTARLTIVGQGDFESELRALIVARRLTDRVSLTGFLAAQQMRDQMQQSWVLAYPSSKEGWGLCVTEAAACGTPAVASNAPGLRESVRDGETGLLVPHGNIAELAEKLHRVLTDDGLRARLSAAAVAWAGRFTWDTTAAQGLNVLAAAAQSPRRGSRTSLVPC